MRDCLDEVSARFKTPNEMVREKRGMPERIVRETAGMDEDALRFYAARMTGKEVEGLLFAIIAGVFGEEYERVRKLLEYRLSRRIVVLLWAFYTFEFENDNLLEIINSASKFLMEKNISIPQAHMLLMAFSEKPHDMMALEIEKYNCLINSFLAYYDVSRDAPLAAAIANSFLKTSGKENFFLNEAWMVRLIQNKKADAGLVSHYIDALTEREYINTINEAIIAHWGDPREAEWGGLSEPLRKKFNRWCYLRDMRGYFNRNEKKLGVYSKYLPFIREIRTHEATGFFVIDLGEFAVLDFGSETSYSYMCAKYALKRVLGEDGDTDVFDRNKKYAEARNFILEESEDELILLNFYDVGKLYIQETFNILLGITPDTRESKNLLAAKLRQRIDNFGSYNQR